MIDIYRAGWQLTKVKGMMIFAALCAAGAVYWGWDLFNTVGLRPADGGALRPLWERIAWGVGVAGLGVGFLAGMWVYGRLYATRIRYDPAADALHVGTLEFLATREKVYSASDVRRSDYYDGNMEGTGVDAPWFSLWLEGRRSPLIVDAKGVFPDAALAARLLKSSGSAKALESGGAGDSETSLDFHHEDLEDLAAPEGRRRWRRLWLASLSQYADEDGHARQWLRAADPVDGFVELRCRYLDDLNLGEGGYAWAEGKGLVSGQEAAAVADFHRLASPYSGPPDDERYRDGEYVALILDDPAWREIVAAAQRARSALAEILSDPEERRVLAGAQAQPV